MKKQVIMFGIVLALIMFSFSNAGAGFLSPVDAENKAGAASDGRSVIVRLVSSDLVQFPQGKTEAPIKEMEFNSFTLQYLFSATGAKKITRAYPNFTAADTVKIDFAGQIVRIGDLTRVIRVEFEFKEKAEEFLTHCKTPESLKREMNLWNQIIQERNLGQAPISEIMQELNKNPEVKALHQRHQENPEIAWAEPIYQIKYQLAPNDPRLSQQWNMFSSDGVNALSGWDKETQTGWSMAILDQGIHDHQDILYAGYSTTIYAHGLACAGIAGAKTNNGLDMAGLAWNTYFGSFNAGTSAAVTADAVYAAMSYGIMNLSLGTTDESFELGTAVRTANDNGRLLCCASGNSGGSWPEYPGYWAFSVGATKNNGQIAGYSCRNPDLVAPGGDGPPDGPEDVLSLMYPDTIWWWSGTSFACPHAAGVAGILSKELVNEQSYYCTRNDLQKIMEKTATDLGTPGYDPYYGWGRINAGAALQKIQSSGVYKIKRESVSGYNSYTESGVYAMVMVEVGNLAIGTYFVKQNTMYRNVSWNHPCLEVPWVWINEQYTNGFSSMNPQYGTNWGYVVDGSVTTTGAQIYTQIYHVWDVGGNECGWYPCQRNQVSYNYSVLGHFNMFAPYNAVSQLIYDGGTSHRIRVMFSDTNVYHDGYQLYISHECGSAEINLSPDCNLYNYNCPWGSVNVTAKVRARIGSEYGPWSNTTTTLNAPNKPSSLRVSVRKACGWPNLNKPAPGGIPGDLPVEILEEFWEPTDGMDSTGGPFLAPCCPGNEPPCLPTNKVKVTWNTPENQYGEPDYYIVRVQMPTIPIQVYYIGPIYVHEIEFCDWPNFGPQHISVLAYKYGLHSNETEETKSVTTGSAVCINYPFGKGAPGESKDQLTSLSASTSFSLSQNQPNPFNPETDISYNLPMNCHVKLIIYNIMGQKIATLVDEQQFAGQKSVHWNGRDESGNPVASGIYFSRIQAGEFSQTKKMVMMK